MRAGYADAVKALNAWGQFPSRIRRRVDDSPETLRQLEQLGSEIQASLAYATGWVGAESPVLGEVFNQLVAVLRAEVVVHARIAWASPAASTPEAMNIAKEPPIDTDRPVGVVPAEWVIVQLFASTIQYRIGWRRYLWARPFLRRRMRKARIVERAEHAFALRSSRILTPS